MLSHSSCRSRDFTPNGGRYGIAGIVLYAPAQAVIEDEYIVIDDPRKDALPGVDGFLSPAPVKATRIEFDFDAMVLRWH